MAVICFSLRLPIKNVGACRVYRSISAPTVAIRRDIPAGSSNDAPAGLQLVDLDRGGRQLQLNVATA